MAGNIMQPHTFLISFFTAHFKRHETKKFRSTYIIPPPTAIWGIIGAMFGIEREKLNEFAQEHHLTVGAELCELKGLATEKATLMSWDDTKFIRTIEDFEFLIEPKYRIGVYAEVEFIEKLKEKIEKRTFKFDIYGGISDCFLKDIENEHAATFMKGTVARGMIPVDIMDGLSKVMDGGKIIKVLYLNTFFCQGFRVEFKLTEPIKTVNGIAVWDVDDVEKFRAGNLEKRIT